MSTGSAPNTSVNCLISKLLHHWTIRSWWARGTLGSWGVKGAGAPHSSTLQGLPLNHATCYVLTALEIIHSVMPIFWNKINTVRAKYSLVAIFSTSVFCVSIRSPTNYSFSPAARLDSRARETGYAAHEIPSTWKLHVVQNRPAD